MQPTFTLQEVQNIISTLIEAHTHWIKTSNMATNDAISQINKYFDKKKQDLVDQQKRVSEALEKKTKESGSKNDCEPTPEVEEEEKKEAVKGKK